MQWPINEKEVLKHYFHRERLEKQISNSKIGVLIYNGTYRVVYIIRSKPICDVKTNQSWNTLTLERHLSTIELHCWRLCPHSTLSQNIRILKRQLHFYTYSHWIFAYSDKICQNLWKKNTQPCLFYIISASLTQLTNYSKSKYNPKLPTIDLSRPLEAKGWVPVYFKKNCHKLSKISKA